MVLSALIGLVIAAALLVIRLSGGLPACGPLPGCDQVALSPQSEVMGIPVAAFGVGYSLTLLAVSLAAFRPARSSILYVAYGLALFGVFVVAYLTYLEVFVIHAICVWCVAYAISIVVTFGAVAGRLRGQARMSDQRPRTAR